MWTGIAVERKVRMVLGIAEFLLDRPVRSLLDVGCGEGSWQPILKRLRPRARYLGVDSSAYAVSRFARARHIRHGEFGRLDALELRRRFDLVVCCDVLHYVPTRALKAGLAQLARHGRGIFYLEAYTRGDAVDGDHRDFHARSAAFYRHLFRGAGLAPVGPHCWAGPEVAESLVALERPGI